jgi:nicotinamidase-related amidase
MANNSNKALLLIDVQNDYFPGGAFPLWGTDLVLSNIERSIARALATGVHVIHIQHIADPAQGIAPFFNRDTPGAGVHPRVKSVAPDAPVVVKAFADSFHETNLDEILSQLQVTELLLCGMMTQNCVTHTALSKAAEKYDVAVLPDACTTVSEILHLIALHALSTRVRLVPSEEAIK